MSFGWGATSVAVGLELLFFALSFECCVFVNGRGGGRFGGAWLGLIVGHFDVLVRPVGRAILLRGLALLAFLLLGCSFVEEGFAVAFDCLLVFLADLSGIVYAVLFVVAFDELLGCLLVVSVFKSRRAREPYVFGKPFQMVFGDFMFVLVDDGLDVRV